MSNELVPVAMYQLRPRDRKIQPVAEKQLANWQFYAKRWIVRPEMLTTQEGHALGAGVQQLHFTCCGFPDYEDQGMPWGGCGMSILLLFDGGNFYNVSAETFLSLVVTHIRNVHRDIEDQFGKVG